MALFFTITLVLLIVYVLIRAVRSQDKQAIWNPISFISLFYVYYCVVPFVNGTSGVYGISDISSAQDLFHFATFLSYICILLGYKKKTTPHFKNWNNFFNEGNSGRIGVVLFLIGIVCYFAIKGVNFSIFAQDNKIAEESDGFTKYIVSLISLFVAASSLTVIEGVSFFNYKFIVVFILSLIIYVFTGFRYHIVFLLISVLTTYYLYNKEKKINYLWTFFLAISLYFSFAIIEVSRTRGGGLNYDAITSIEKERLNSGSHENSYVYVMSALSIELYNKPEIEFLYFEPIVNAILMPIPRSIASWKPDGSYTKKTQEKLFSTTDYGAACLFFVEGFMSFGWIGLIFFSYCVGWISKIFWENYKKNEYSLGAIILLSLYNAYTYTLISRGYLAQELRTFIFHVPMPFWISNFLLNVFRKHFR